MPIQSSCPSCNSRYLLPEAQRGKRVRCKHCGDDFVVARGEDLPVLEADDSDDELPVLEEDYEPAGRSRREERGRPRSCPPEYDDDDEDDEDDEPARGGGGTVMVVAVIVALLLLLVVGGGLTAVFLMTSPSGNQVAINPPPPPDLGGGGPGGGNNNPPPPPPGNRDKIEKPPDGDIPPKDVANAIEMLNHPRPQRRRLAMTYLLDAPINDAKRDEVERALEALEQDAELGPDAIKALKRWAPDGELKRLARRAGHDNQRIWSAAMNELSLMSEDEAAKAIADQLPRNDRRADAARHLGRMGKRGEKYLLPCYNHQDDRVRATAREVLTQLGTSNEIKVRQCLVDLDLGKENPDDRIVYGQRAGSALQTLKTLKPVADSEINSRIVKHLEPLLDVAEPNLRNPAMAAMEVWVTKEHIPSLLMLAAKGRTPFSRNENAIKLLMRFKDDERLIPMLVSILPDEKHRDNAMKALVVFGPKAEEVGIQLTTNADVSWRRYGTVLLGEVGSQKGMNRLRSLRQVEKDKLNRVNIDESLKKIAAREKEKADAMKDKKDK